MLLNEYKLSIPKVSMNDWEEAVDSSTGLIQGVLIAQTNGVRILKSIKETMATTERIGWLNIWAKAFAALESTAAAITHRSKLGLLLCQRNTFELMLQMHTILDPIRMSKNASLDKPRLKDSGEYAMRSCIERLRAYTAWCLWHDKAYINEMLNPKSMRDIWNFDFFDGIQNRENPSAQIEQFLKKVDGHLDEKAFREVGRNVRDMYTDKIKQIDEWMADPRLRKWADTINQVSRQNIVGIPFFLLFDRSDASIPKRLLKEGMRFCYPSYILSSIASHGSSMEEFIQIEGDTIKPVLTGDDEQINILAPEVTFRCQHIFTILQTLTDEMAENPQIRS